VNPQELKDTPTDALIDRRASALELIGRRALAFHAAHPRACQVCDGVGLDLKAPAPPAGRPDSCPACTGAKPARHPLDTARRLSRNERDNPGQHIDTSRAVFLAALQQIADEITAELIARGWSAEDDRAGADYCPDDDDEEGGA